MRDWRGSVDLAPAAKRELGAVLAPVEWRSDVLALDPVPAFAQPQRRRRIAAILDELAPFAVGRAPAGELVAREEDAVTRALGVKGESLIARADFDHAVAAGVPA